MIKRSNSIMYPLSTFYIDGISKILPRKTDHNQWIQRTNHDLYSCTDWFCLFIFFTFIYSLPTTWNWNCVCHFKTSPNYFCSLFFIWFCFFFRDRRSSLRSTRSICLGKIPIFAKDSNWISLTLWELYTYHTHHTYRRKPIIGLRQFRRVWSKETTS